MPEGIGRTQAVAVASYAEYAPARASISDVEINFFAVNINNISQFFAPTYFFNTLLLKPEASRVRPAIMNTAPLATTCIMFGTIPTTGAVQFP